MPSYSIDFRRKMVDAYEKGKTSIREVARRFLVSPDTVRRLLKQHRLTGDLTPQKCGSKRESILSEYTEAVIKIVEDRPDFTLWQYCEQIREELGVDVSTSTMDRFCQQHNLTLKKNSSQRKGNYTRSAAITSGLLAENRRYCD
jgi:transposase